jgi:hypothetical protein
MITLRPDGTPHAVRVGVALVDGKLWSSGTQGRLRTRFLRRDPRCTLFVFDQGWNYLTLETVATIRDGPDAPEQNLRLFRAMQSRPAPANLVWEGQERSAEEFLRIMAEERRLIYEFEIKRAYGMYRA